jgi:lactate dehydrogenase-like 2-hydroxyacid dehydrogenase
VSEPVFIHPFPLMTLKFDEINVVSLPAEEPARSAFLRDVAPTLEVATGLGARGFPADFLAAAKSLKLIACASVGVDGFDIPALAARGVTVTNTPGVNYEDCAEFAMGLALSVARRIALGDARMRLGQWQPPGPRPRKLSGRKIGIVGLGDIGMAIARRAAAFDMQIAWYGPRPKPAAPYRYVADLMELARWADVLVLSAQANASNEKMINAPVIEALGPEGILINIARGSLVDEDALIAALKAGTLGGAGLDVYQTEPVTDPGKWLDVPNMTLTPHMAGGTHGATETMGAIVKENIRRYFAAEPLLYALS